MNSHEYYSSDDSTVLRLDRVGLSFGRVKVLNDVNVGVRPSEILGLIGPNGAGKSSLLNCINGFYKPQKGDIFLENTNITNMAPYRIAKLGVGRTFQGIHLYEGMSVQDNIMAGCHIHMKSNFLKCMIYWPWVHLEEIKALKVTEDIIDLLEIQNIRKSAIGELGYGLRKRVDLGRALALNPKVLLLDEPMAGMNFEEKEDMARFILDIKEAGGITIILVEHDMEVVMDLADTIVVMDQGSVIAHGTPAEIKCNKRVIEAYLGSET